MQYEPRNYELLNACKYSTALRQQTYVQAQQPSISVGSEVRIALPIECLDMSSAYVAFDLVPSGVINPVALKFTLSLLNNVGAVTGGIYQLFVFGQSIGGNSATFDAFNGTSTATQVIAQLNAFEPLVSRGGVASLAGGLGTDTIATGIQIQIAMTGYYGGIIEGRDISATSSLSSALGPMDVLVTINTAATRGSPRFERTLPIINRLYAQINSTTVIDINDANKLMSIISFTDSVFDDIGKFLEYPNNESGLFIGSRMKCKIDLSFIDLFQSILPLNLLNNPQVQLYMNLEQPQYCMVTSDATNSTGQSYTLENVKLKYYRLLLTESEKNEIASRVNSSSGLLIPFKNWTTFKQNIPGPNTGVNLNVIFNPNRKNFLGCYFVMLSSSYYGDATNECKITTFLNNAKQNYRLKIGSYYWPVDTVESSNSYNAIVEQIETVKDFTQLVKSKIITGDMFCLQNFSGIGYIGNDPNDVRFAPWYEVPVHMMNISGIATCDIGFSNKSKLCERLALEGVDTSSVPNVVLEINGMNVLQNCDLLIYSYSQEYLRFRGTSFDWIK